MNQQPQVVYVQKQSNGCLWLLAAVGLLAIVAFLWMLWGTVSYARDVNQVPAIFEQTVATLDAINAPEFQQQPGVVILSTSTPFPVVVQATATPFPTATAYPTYTAVPLLTLSDYGLPIMGPYTLEQVNQCREIVNGGNLDTMTSPQRELCEMYTK